MVPVGAIFRTRHRFLSSASTRFYILLKLFYYLSLLLLLFIVVVIIFIIIIIITIIIISISIIIILIHAKTPVCAKLSHLHLEEEVEARAAKVRAAGLFSFVFSSLITLLYSSYQSLGFPIMLLTVLNMLSSRYLLANQGMLCNPYLIQRA